jgi:hypothetical protein
MVSTKKNAYYLLIKGGCDGYYVDDATIWKKVP